MNLYKLHAETAKSKSLDYLVASRASDVDGLKAISHENKLDAVAIFAVDETKDHVILIRQYRYAIGDYIYEFPSGLVEDGEDIYEVLVREMKEETGLDLTVAKSEYGYNRPFYTSAGMSDETCSVVFGETSGDYLEENEEIQVVMADKDEAKRIPKEENVCLKTALILTIFIGN